MLDPDDYDDDPYGHVTNQAGHAAIVGVGLCLALLWVGWPVLWVPVVVAGVYAGGWEWGVQRYLWRRQFDWRDSIMDTACVMAGASILCGALYDVTDLRNPLLTVTAAWTAWLALVFWGGLRRWK